ncbi:hypothetical protein IIA79_01475 [bacterium]|nr:hypothetical protein [bacterium]
MDPNVAAGLSVLLGLIGGLIFFLIEKESKYVKFYAFQSLILSLCHILSLIPIIGWLWGLFILIMQIVALINAFSGKIFKVPVIGNIAAKQAGLE